MRSALVLVPSLLLATCLPRPVTPAGCAKDVDCKGTRICERGACVDPPAGRAGAAPGAISVPTVEAMKEGVSKSLETLSEIGDKVQEAALRAGYGPTIRADRSRFRVIESLPVRLC